jgi:hypothetical protein
VADMASNVVGLLASSLAPLDVGVPLVILAYLAAFWMLPIVMSFMKGRPWLGCFGIFLATPFAWWGAIRIARPDSYWARTRYSPDEMREAEEAFGPSRWSSHHEHVVRRAH